MLFLNRCLSFHFAIISNNYSDSLNMFIIFVFHEMWTFLQRSTVQSTYSTNIFEAIAYIIVHFGYESSYICIQTMQFQFERRRIWSCRLKKN